MDASTTQYDARYLAGIVLFNRGDFFEAHEVWESLWMEARPEKKFYQGLIQAAVALCHFCNGNMRGAAKLFKSGRDYMQRFESPLLGLDHTDFWQKMERCFADVLIQGDPVTRVPVPEELIPTIELNPAPGAWPDPEPFLHEDEDRS
jgi:predicted metal-dependent hydrolase